MATRGLTFVESRPPRAVGLSERAVDEHKELIGDLYLRQNYTRDQVIQHLKTKLSFSLSRDQFSKATRRWGFQKQRRGGSSIQPPLNDTASQCTTSDTARSELLNTADANDVGDQELMVTNESSKRPRSVASSISRSSDNAHQGLPSPLTRRPVKRLKPKSESDDTDLILTPSTEEGGTESRSRYQYKYDDELSANYLACCYRYTKAFCCYCKISMPFQYQTFSPKQRRDRMLDMARTAKTRKTSEIVRVMMESELKTSNDPLSEDGSKQYPPGEPKMCPMQSFLFHRHLAEIYTHRSDGSSMVHKHLDKARGFTKTLDTLAPASIDLWTLLCLLPGYKVTNIPEDLLNSLEWDATSLTMDMKDCLERCCGALSETDFLSTAMQHYDAAEHKKINRRLTPTDMYHLALENSPLRIWTETSFLFTFFWTKIQDKAPPVRGHPTISATQFLMVVSRMIVRRSSFAPKIAYCFGDLPELLAPYHQVYVGVVLELLHENLSPSNQIKREFVTEFVEHYSWSPPAARESVLVQRVKTFQIEALESVLATRRESRPTTPNSITLREVTTLREEVSDVRRKSTDNEFLNWLVAQEDRLASTSQRGTKSYVNGGQYTPSLDSSSASSYLRTCSSAYHVYLNALNGNPTISRSLASRSSRSSQVSVSSSFKRFKASALNRRNSSESMMGLDLYDPGRQLQSGSFQAVQDLQFQRYFEVTMGLPTLPEYTSQKARPEEDEKPTVRGTIGRLLKVKRRDGLNER